MQFTCVSCNLNNIPNHHEVLNLNQLRGKLDESFETLDAEPADFCKICHSRIRGLQVVTADIDQAFEACSASTVPLCTAWCSSNADWLSTPSPPQTWTVSHTIPTSGNVHMDKTPPSFFLTIKMHTHVGHTSYYNLKINYMYSQTPPPTNLSPL